MLSSCTPLRELKRVTGPLPTSPTIPGQFTAELELVAEPEVRIDIRQRQQGSQNVVEVLIKWKGLPLFEATWEDTMSIAARFPYFHLEDKQYYMPATRELSQLSRVLWETLVIQYFSEMISGITTIRCFDQYSRFQPTYMKIVDVYSRPEFQVAATMKWLVMRLDAFSGVTFTFLLVFSMYFRDSINPACKVRYAPHLPLILHGVTCTFPAEMKIEIVERTRRPQNLRSRLSIMPQDPTMFERTIRSNLDPLEQCVDAQIWDILEKCQLGDEDRKMDRDLDSNVHENRENWTTGQGQLICLGRVLLKKTKVLVFEEATGSTNTDTNNLIQQTLRNHFSDYTLVTIAHHITSVLDNDMGLFLNHGVAKEYDPHHQGCYRTSLLLLLKATTSEIHPVFHVSRLKRCMGTDPASAQIPIPAQLTSAGIRS
ncbi:hypothetical protein AgCh_039593 [Apium graveolens]